MNLGLVEVGVIIVVALLVFGPERLPEMARQAGQLLARLRQETSKSVEELKRAADVEDLDRELRGLSRDLRDVKSSVSKALTEANTPSGKRPDDRPPPTDPDAT